MVSNRNENFLMKEKKKRKNCAEIFFWSFNANNWSHGYWQIKLFFQKINVEDFQTRHWEK